MIADELIPEYDELHAISDLHLGGDGDFQIFGMTKELEGLILHLAAKPAPTPRVALVVNGDFVDFLAEAPARYFDPFEAKTKLGRIAGDPTFQPVFVALKKFVAAPGRTLIVNMGNHDLELSLPWVRNALLDLLADGDPGRRGRTVVVTDGTGVRCRVGPAHVLCVHGNEVDAWNVADHETIRRMTRDMYQGRSVPPWTPNAGTKMVIDVMNEVKRRYPFVDLLKPEVQAVIPTLLALDSSLAARLPRAIPIAARTAWDRLRMAVGLLAAAEQTEVLPLPRDDEPPLSRAPTSQDGASAAPTAPPVRVRREQRKLLAKALLDGAEARFADGRDAMTLLGQADATSQLGVAGALVNLARNDVVNALREALENLDKDRSFDIHARDETYRLLDERVGPEIGFLLAGHTHLARALPRGGARGCYLNTGTWARLIRLAPDVLRSPGAFRAVYDAFAKGKMAALQDSNLVWNRPTFASVWKDGASARGELREYDASANPSPFKSLHAAFVVG
jgi:UDP-2,3-diacylglucosamine pyrophosphatase LpxH